MAIEAHIRVDGNTSVALAHEWTKEIENNLRKRFGKDAHVMLHVEPSTSKH